ncbi:MAG: FecR domain-containing protein, partial [Burkholderiales bacterium]|nr:FecR domain-containing protein [Burkholderiales bacterium]
MRPSLPSLLRLQQTIIFVALCLSIPSWPQAANVTPGSIVSTPPDVTYFAVQGDTLSAIAKRFTDKLQNWHILGRRNKITDDRTIPIGTAIVIPLELLPEEDSEAKVIAMAGSPTAKPVNGDEVPLSVGAILKEGAQIVTGKNGFLTLSLSDDSRVSIPSNSQVSLTKLRKTRFTGSPRTQISLIQGKIESRVTSLISNKGRFEVRSPLAIAGVRGTHFRVGVNENGTANEVLTGGVAVEKSDQKKSDGLLLTAGKGNIIGVSGVGQAVDLLPPPTMETRYQLQERPTVVFNVNTTPAAKGYRVQIANDEAMQDVIAENRFTQNRFKFEGLSDGQYYVRITAIDTLGLEGLPLVSSFRLKARPEPPFSVEPKNKVRADHVDFSWTQASNAQSYHLQVAKDANFSQVVLDQADITAVQLAGIKLPLGNYFWRVATIATTKTGKDQGPYGDT